MTEITEKLASRGYWRTEIRPTAFTASRVESLSVLREAVRAARVELRGWDFPHLKEDDLIPDSVDSIGNEIDWRVHVEVWRAFLSGQFVHRAGIWVDWMDQDFLAKVQSDWKPSVALPIVDSLWALTERFEFAARYSQTPAGDDPMSVSISLHGLAGRSLLGDHHGRRWFGNYGPAKVTEFRFEQTLSRQELLSSAGKLAITAASKLFALCGYEANEGVLESIQGELLSGRKL